MVMAGTVNNEGRVTMAAVMYNGEVSADDSGDQMEDVMGGSGSGGGGGQGLDEDDDKNGGNGSSDDKR